MTKPVTILICLLWTVLLTAQNKEQFFTASPLKMNVVYIGIENPFEIMTTGKNEEKTLVSVTQGTITKRGAFSYSVRPVKTGKMLISVYEISKGDTVSCGSHEFRVKRIPDPVPRIAGKTGGMISKSLLISQTGIVATLDNFDFSLRFKVHGYTFLYPIGEYTKRIEVSGAKFTEEVLSAISKCQPGDRVYFENIKAGTPDGTKRNIGTIVFTLE